MGGASSLFMVLVAVVIVIVFVTLIGAIGLSVLVDTALTARTDTGEIIRYGTATGAAIDHLWKAFSASSGALIGLITGKVW